MRFIASALLLFLISLESFGQGTVVTGEGTGTPPMSVGGSTDQGLGVGANSALGGALPFTPVYGYGTAVPLPVTAATTPVPNYQLSTGSTTSPLLTAVPGLLGACASAVSNLLGGKNEKNIDEMEEIADKANDQAGYQPQPGWTTRPRKLAKYGAAVSKMSGTCEQKFIEKKAPYNVGPWGRTVLEEIKKKEDSYVNNAPPDLVAACPKYKSFDKTDREMFWVWTFASLASAESSCNNTAANYSAPNVRKVGPAAGLFQVDPTVCATVGERRNIFEGDANVRCAVRLLGNELQKRDNLSSPTSRGPAGTYWGPLRNDDGNRARGGDINGAVRFRGLVKTFEGCK